MAQRGLISGRPEMWAERDQGQGDERETERAESLRIAAIVLDTVVKSSTSARSSIGIRELSITVGKAMGIEKPGFGDFPKIREGLERAMDVISELSVSESRASKGTEASAPAIPPPPGPPPEDLGHPETGGGLGPLTR